MTSIGQVATVATFGSVRVVLAVGHNLADHVIGQTDHQAGRKAAPSAAEVADGVSPQRGRGACLGHIVQYHLVMAVMAVMLALIWAVLPLQMSWASLAEGLAVSAWITGARCAGCWSTSGRCSPRPRGSEYPDTLSTALNLAVWLADVGRVGEAVVLGEETLEVQRRVLGLEHQDTLDAVSLPEWLKRQQAEGEAS